MRRILAPSVFAFLVTFGARASAQQAASERALAEGLFQDGRALLAAGNVAEACKKFAASYRIDPAGGTLMNLASCHEREGKTATAWAEFKDAVVVAARANNRVRQAEAQERITALEKRLARVTLVPPAGPPVAGLEVRIDNVPVDADGRSALPVDPGTHAITATATGRRPWHADVIVKEGTTQPVNVPLLEVLGPPPPMAAPPPVAPPPPREAASESSWRVPVGVTLTAIGGAGLIIGAVAGGLVLSQHATLTTQCPAGKCPAGDASSLSSYHAKSVASTVGFVAGGALAVAGIVVLVTAPKASGPTVGAFFGPTASGLTGSF